MAMQIRSYGHSCLLVQQGGTRILLDPGSLSREFEGVRDLDAILITHIHADHLDIDRLAGLMDNNPEAQVICDEGSAVALSARHLPCQVMRDGDITNIGVPVTAIGTWHAVIHPDLPAVRNVGYLINDRLFHPGDAFTEPGREIEILAVPAGAPWMKISEAINYLRTIRPTYAIPIHERVLAHPGSAFRMLEKLAPSDTQVVPLDGDNILNIPNIG
jgi:L-ascorbate metabolism protein UlaG (beta-lactamase superfamily)